jgi:hypothetical protein
MADDPMLCCARALLRAATLIEAEPPAPAPEDK